MSDILQRILATKAQEVTAGKARMPQQEVRAATADLPAPRGFTRRMRMLAASGSAVIAEIKKASPSAGIIRADFQVPRIAQSYAAGGAACLSIVTDKAYFHGANEYLQEARQACDLPLLRKDFLIDPWQVYESRVLGADCILLIVAALDSARLQELDGLAHETGLDVLVEVHDEAELEQALKTGATLIGVNNRDLRTFRTDLGVSERLRALIPQPRIMVAESGIHKRQDVQRLQQADIHAFLVGEAFMRAEDPGSALQLLFNPDKV
jgi:indole-3-glycerol phosphate synthase